MKCLIFGCGYLGSVVAQLWQKAGQDVHVVTRDKIRSKSFVELGYQTVVGDITDSSSLRSIQGHFDVCLFAVGFDRSRYHDIREVYVNGLDNVLKVLANRIGHFIYISSTGVYGNHKGGWVDETTKPDPQRVGGKACLEAESLIINSWLSKNYSILRLAGIYGPARIPRLDSIKNKDWSQLGKNGHINLIHVQDAAQIVCQVADSQLNDQTFLVSDGQAVQRRTFYDFIAARIGSGPIDWSVSTNESVTRRSDADKRISNRKLIDSTGYQFQFPSYKTGIPASINASS